MGTPVTPLTRLQDRGPRWWLALGVILVALAAVVGVAVVGGRGTGSQILKPVASAVAQATRTPAGATPGTPQPGATQGPGAPLHAGPIMLAAVPVVAEVDDPVGDPVLAPTGGGSATPPPDGQPALDITHLAAWVADGVLRAQLTLAGTAPAQDRRTSIHLWVMPARASSFGFDLPVCTADPCGPDFSTIPPFTAAVTQRTGSWVGDTWTVDYTVLLADLCVTDTSSFTVYALAAAMSDTAGGWCWYDDTSALAFRGSTFLGPTAAASPAAPSPSAIGGLVQVNGGADIPRTICTPSWCRFISDIVANDARLSGCYVLQTAGGTATGTWGTVAVNVGNLCDAGFGFQP